MLPEDLPAGLWEEFKKHRKLLKSPMTPYAEERAFAKLERLKLEGYNPIDVINNSIDGGWKGLFPIKNGHNAATAPAQMNIQAVCCICKGPLDSGFVFFRGERKCHKC